MNYEPNTHQWKPGDLVIHDADAKHTKMLMKVVGYDQRTGQCKAVYLHPDPLMAMSGVFSNDLKYLHDPRRFGIAVAEAEHA